MCIANLLTNRKMNKLWFRMTFLSFLRMIFFMPIKMNAIIVRLKEASLQIIYIILLIKFNNIQN